MLLLLSQKRAVQVNNEIVTTSDLIIEMKSETKIKIGERNFYEIRSSLTDTAELIFIALMIVYVKNLKVL
ncbi:protein-tyrosine-phosphatase [Chryseobacterium sp. H1D6B]|nr:protein-tyrosine-phosphatase [Chryseobacterium sp. H1D6B]